MALHTRFYDLPVSDWLMEELEPVVEAMAKKAVREFISDSMNMDESYYNAVNEVSGLVAGNLGNLRLLKEQVREIVNASDNLKEMAKSVREDELLQYAEEVIAEELEKAGFEKRGY